jgi:hypothetical protein
MPLPRDDAQSPPQCSGRASRRFYFPSEPPAIDLRASGNGHSSSQATGKAFPDVSGLGIGMLGGYPRAWGCSFAFNPPLRGRGHSRRQPARQRGYEATFSRRSLERSGAPARVLAATGPTRPEAPSADEGIDTSPDLAHKCLPIKSPSQLAAFWPGLGHSCRLIGATLKPRPDLGADRGSTLGIGRAIGRFTLRATIQVNSPARVK